MGGGYGVNTYHERGPYWLHGAVHLSFITGNKQLQSQVEEWVLYLIKNVSKAAIVLFFDKESC